MGCQNSFVRDCRYWIAEWKQKSLAITSTPLRSQVRLLALLLRKRYKHVYISNSTGLFSIPGVFHSKCILLISELQSSMLKLLCLQGLASLSHDKWVSICFISSPPLLFWLSSWSESLRLIWDYYGDVLAGQNEMAIQSRSIELVL